jgi:hypothetical protein
MHRILFLPDIRLFQKPDTGYPVRAGYRISSQIIGQLDIYIFCKVANKFTALKALKQLKQL